MRQKVSQHLQYLIQQRRGRCYHALLLESPGMFLRQPVIQIQTQKLYTLFIIPY